MLSALLARRLARPVPRLQFRNYVAPTQQLTEGERTIYQKLTERFSPSTLRVEDVSGGCGTFYQIEIASDAFKDLSTVKQHRLVNETLKKDIEGIHGLQLKTIVPQS
ncbi:bola-like protein [Obba rivulosa]|uniref:Bola-like protein n=1 Tax=Obba rivulosa TaxID=1052685 RepID=A0A8E2J6F2_9APHY|nr:bola-like protein [Obba rivulosa]